MKIRWVKEGLFTEVENVNAALVAPELGFYWIDADVDELSILQPLFGMHDLAVEDCLSQDEQRPKFEIYNTHYFIVMNSIRFDDEEIFLRALNIFLGKHYIITVTKTKLNELRSLKPILWEEEVNRPDSFLYRLLDLVVDSYFLVGDRLDRRIELLEENILVQTKKTHLDEIIGLRSEILWLRKSLGPQRDVLAKLGRTELKLVDVRLQQYFSDIYENALKISESFDTYRDLIGNLREAYQLSIGNRANAIMRVFTAITTIFMPLTFITGIYGMNVDNLPLAHMPFSSLIIISTMLIIGLGLFFLFRRKDWL